MLRIGRRGDTSPLEGLAYANGAFANANVFAANWLQRKTALSRRAVFAGVNVLIPLVCTKRGSIPIIGAVNQEGTPKQLRGRSLGNQAERGGVCAM